MHLLFFSFQSHSTSKHSILDHFRHISVSFQLFLMKIAPLESSRYPLFNRTKRRFLLGRLGWRERSQSLIQSPPILLPPFLSYLSEFLVVFHENCTIGKHTLRSIKPHKATLSIRQSLLRISLTFWPHPHLQLLIFSSRNMLYNANESDCTETIASSSAVSIFASARFF